MMELSIRVEGVQQVRDGVIIMLVQDKLQVPVAEDSEDTDEARVFKKMRQGLKQMGFNIDVMQMPMPCNPNTAKTFRTAIWVTAEDYEKMGKPTVGDMLKCKIEKVEDECPDFKPKSKKKGDAAV